MKLPIPQDWDGETWQCIEIQWPDSDTWRAILLGALSQYILGRLWDERTGTITDIQQVGWAIWNKNSPLNACGGETIPDNGTTPPIPFFGGWEGYFEDSEEYEMNGPCPPVKIENGILYYWWCCQWQEIGALSVVPQPIEDIPPWEETDTFSACGKASAIIESLYLIADGVWDNKDGPDYILNIGAVDNLLPQYDLNNYGIMGLLRGARSLDDTYTQSEFLNTTYKLQFLCQLAPLLTADNSGVNDDLYKQLLGLVASIYPSDTVTWWQGLLGTFGQSILSEIAVAGAGDTTADCTCPGELDPLTEPTANGWYLGPKLDDVVISNNGSEGYKAGCMTDIPEHDVFGCCWDGIVTGDQNVEVKPMNAATGPCEGLGTSIWGDSSALPSLQNCASVNNTVGLELWGYGGWTACNGGQSWNNTPETPDFGGGVTLAAEWQIGFNKVSTLTVRGFRWIHNINSPSHS